MQLISGKVEPTPPPQPTAQNASSQPATGQRSALEGDQILYQGEEIATMVARLIEVLAVLAYAPGGFRFGPLRLIRRKTTSLRPV